MDLKRMYMKEFPGTKVGVHLVRESAVAAEPGVEPIVNAETAYRYLREGLQDRDRETCVALLLNNRLIPIGVHLVAVGLLDRAVLHPRELYKAAILASAHRLIVAHNHPSGDPSPSKADRDITSLLAYAGKLLGIQLIDHIIVGHGTFESLADLCNSIWDKESSCKDLYAACSNGQDKRGAASRSIDS